MIYDKKAAGKLTLGLYLHECACKCNHPECNFTLIDSRLIAAYSKLRNKIGHPIVIDDVYRCPAHNKEVGGVDLSRHMSGEAIDISLVNIKVNQNELQNLVSSCGFTYYKFYPDKNFLHLDVREN